MRGRSFCLGGFSGGGCFSRGKNFCLSYTKLTKNKNDWEKILKNKGYIYYTTMPSNIHTIADLASSNSPNDIDNGPEFKKSKKWLKALKNWINIGKANDDIGCLVPTFIDRATKRPHNSIRFKYDRGNERWNTTKLHKWINQDKIHKLDLDIGVFISGGIACLDFDCEKDYKWFRQYFNINDNDYIITKRTGKRSHDCGCDTDIESFYHLYFCKDEFFMGKKTRVNCCLDVEGKEKLNIDFLRDSPEGTPHVCKEWGEGSNREIVSCPEDMRIKPLPAVISSYFQKHWRKTKRENMKGERNLKYIELAEAIPHEQISGNDMENICRDLIQLGVDVDIILALSHKVRKDYGTGRIGTGPTRLFSDIEHEHWIKGICEKTKRNGKREAPTINKLSRKHNLGGHTTITAKWLSVMGRKFDLNYLHDLKHNVSDDNERGSLVKRYYNHFFIMTTGMTKNAIYRRDYDADGNINSIRTFADLASFTNWCGIKMVCWSDGKAIDTAKYWFDCKDITYDKVEFRPFGIKNNTNTVPPEVFNTFEGFAMKYEPNYSKPQYDKLGDRINKHFREVICWDEDKGINAVNEKYYNHYRAWLYHTIVLGKKANVGIVHFSKQQGTGKSSWTNGLIKYVFGEHCSLLNSSFNHTVKSQFTDWMVENILTVFEEMPENSGMDNDTKIGWQTFKSLITEDKVRGEQKFVGAESMDIFINFLFNSNNFYAIPKMMLARRLLVNRCNPKRVGDNPYFIKLMEAIDCYEGMENWFHRYIIGQYNQFSAIRVSPIDAFMVDTKYRRQILARGEDTLIYFFKDILDGLADPDKPENPYHKHIGKHFTLSRLQDNYKTWLQLNRGDTPYDYKDDINKFEKKIEEKFEISLRAGAVKVSQPLTNDTPAVHTPVISKNRVGKCIVMDETTFNLISEVVKHKALNTENPLEFDSVKDYEDKEIDIASVLPCGDFNDNNGFGLDDM